MICTTKLLNPNPPLQGGFLLQQIGKQEGSRKI